MIHFIPSWHKTKEWKEKEQTWYVRREHTEFDDTVKQIQLFHRNSDFDYHIILLHFAPNFRHFLHRQGVFNAPYWSCFDAIQSVSKKRARVLSFHDLKWPDEIEFLYTPFVIVAMLHKQKYAEIFFGEDGNLIKIDMYRNGQLARTNEYDDRGFISCSTVFKDGVMDRSDYLSEDGIWKMRVLSSSGKVLINPETPYYSFFNLGKETRCEFNFREYDSIEQVLDEVFTAFVEMLDTDDVFCVAAEDELTKLAYKALSKRKMILSFFEHRYKNHNPELTDAIIHSSRYLLTDSEENINWLRDNANIDDKPVKDITPYDSRIDQGLSAQIAVQNILVPVDGIEDTVFEELIHCLAEFMSNRERTQVHLFSRRPDYNLKNELLDKTRNVLLKYGFDERWATEAEDNRKAAINIDEDDSVKARFYVDQCVDELSVSKTIRFQRIIVDMRDIADLYLHITGISTAIPLIVRRGTRYVHDGKNGVIVDDIKRIPEILEMYLDQLLEWNKVLVYDYNLSQQYTSKVLVEMWKEVIESID